MLYLKDEESRGADEDARDSAGDQKGGSETDRAEADRKILPGVLSSLLCEFVER